MNPEQRVDVLRAACCVAGIDGNTNKYEAKLIDKIARDVGCGVASVNAMVQRAQSDPDFHKEQFSVLKEDPKQAIVPLIHVAMADGEVSQEERAVLKNLADNLKIPTPVFDELMVKVQQLLESSDDVNS